MMSPITRLPFAFVLAAVSFAVHASDDVVQQSLGVLPASGVTDPDRTFRSQSNVQNNFSFDVSKQAQRDYESRLRTMTPAIPMDFHGPGTPTASDGAKSRMTVIPRATVPGPNAAPYTQVDRFGGEWGAATVNMPVQQARDYEARVRSELAERDERAHEARHPEVRFPIPPREMPKPAASTKPSSGSGPDGAN